MPMQLAQHACRAGSLHLDVGLCSGLIDKCSRQRRLEHARIERSNFIVPIERLF
jgi:hypothetical protein